MYIHLHLSWKFISLSLITLFPSFSDSFEFCPFLLSKSFSSKRRSRFFAPILARKIVLRSPLNKRRWNRSWTKLEDRLSDGKREKYYWRRYIFENQGRDHSQVDHLFDYSRKKTIYIYIYSRSMLQFYNTPIYIYFCTAKNLGKFIENNIRTK